ncbi:ABC transporter ATP-binding protein [Brockia lithotrophica]|uniref:Putative ABC transport system ATP-binding protein n=1 Tax=Brockia lithotrophica TaxID=933949 RepID=A0A660KSR1_9BACL|nr:ABC transporter ATP-binding protein [Brockia lithotrophica]RKQ83520.1 putative ABC transport system ATP-binding protein [Brockia lithotrophica]
MAGLTFSVEAGDFTAVMGPSGSGKTTLLNLIAGLDRPTSGEIVVQGRHVEDLGEEELSCYRREMLGFVFQDFNLLSKLTVLENVLLPLSLRGRVGPEERRQALDVLRRVGLKGKEDRFPYQLSGGEQQRVSIARALVHRPALVLADEPTGNLDTGTGRAILELFAELNRELGATILLVTHDPFAASYGSRVLFLRDGRLYAELRRGEDRGVYTQRILDTLSAMEGATVGGLKSE